MITLLMDGLIAAVKLIDRACTAVEKNVRLRWNSPLPVADAQPAGADASAASGPGGHPEHETTSSLLLRAAWLIELDRDFPHEPNIATGLRDRAAQFAAIGD